MSNMETKTERQAWMSLLSKVSGAQLAELFGAMEAPAFDWLRAPETGGVMVQGRMGGAGAPFNLGEMTVTRCALTLREGGTVGHAYVQGRDKTHAQQAALIDALMQTDAAAHIRATVLEPLQTTAQARKDTRARKAAATKVDFFTMVRGED